MEPLSVNSSTIPAWLVALFMIFTGIVWLGTRKHAIRMDTRIIAWTMIIEGLVYGLSFQFTDIPVEVRGFYSRLMLIIICMAQSLPLTISYIRRVRSGPDREISASNSNDY